MKKKLFSVIALLGLVVTLNSCIVYGHPGYGGGYGYHYHHHHHWHHGW